MAHAYESWLGREETVLDRIETRSIQALAATLDVGQVPSEGEPLPPGWQWLFFNGATPRSELGADGHPKRGGFLPPIELPRRMWAGSKLQYLRDIPIGAQARRYSRILTIEHKAGKTGPLWFVTVEHTIFCDGNPCIVEQQDIVYRDAAPKGATMQKGRVHESQANWGSDFYPDTTLLFRYSALTFNGHRIHYDQEYARNEENYPDLVVHGPLTATLLQRLALEHGQGRPLSRFEFRGVSPLFVDRSFRLEGRREDDGSLSLWARGPDGELAMSAAAAFE